MDSDLPDVDDDDDPGSDAENTGMNSILNLTCIKWFCPRKSEMMSKYRKFSSRIETVQLIVLSNILCFQNNLMIQHTYSLVILVRMLQAFALTDSELSFYLFHFYKN